MRNRLESPLIDPRTADIPLDGGEAVDGLAEAWKRDGESAGTVDRWRWILSWYAKPGHAIYSGLNIEPGGWANADLDNILLAAKLGGDTFRACYRSRAG